MFVIPVINEAEFGEVLKKIKIAAKFSSWIHFDISDGKFTSHKTWNSPEELKRLQASSVKSQVNLEVHLMVANPEAVIKDWILAGVKRIIMHLESLISDPNLRIHPNVPNKTEIGLAINPETPVEKLIPFISINQPKISINQRCCKFVQILAVNPGPGGQKFQPAVLEKIKFLKKNYPDVMIEVDGGINLENAKLIKKAGADIIASSSYIFKNSNPQKAYEELSKI